MSWVDLLPKVGGLIRNERNKLTAELASAEELEKQVAALRAGVREGRAALLDRIMKQWALCDIEQVATAAADRGQSLPPGFVKDGELREALCAPDGAPSPLEVLQAFRAGRVIRRHNLFSTVIEEEQRAMLHWVFDWWNYGAVPLLICLEGQGRTADVYTGTGRCTGGRRRSGRCRSSDCGIPRGRESGYPRQLVKPRSLSRVPCPGGPGRPG